LNSKTKTKEKKNLTLADFQINNEGSKNSFLHNLFLRKSLVNDFPNSEGQTLSEPIRLGAAQDVSVQGVSLFDSLGDSKIVSTEHVLGWKAVHVSGTEFERQEFGGVEFVALEDGCGLDTNGFVAFLVLVDSLDFDGNLLGESGIDDALVIDFVGVKFSWFGHFV
jgi:hypothetical protein